MSVKIGIIGGSGMDNPDFFTFEHSLDIDTPWGKPASPLKEGRIANVPIVFLSRHGYQHQVPPSQVNYRAHIDALRQAGCTHILATTAVGSLREHIAPGDFVIMDQFIDFARSRQFTFHDLCVGVVHTAMPDPFNERLRTILCNALESLGYKFHPTGTVVTIEGPRFSTRAESRMFQAWGADIINMSIATEAQLANEIGLPFAAIAMCTDYDSWHKGHESVTWEAVQKIFAANIVKMQKLLTEAVPQLVNNCL